jgi:hypothetical protein
MKKQKNDTTPYGVSLATNVAIFLKNGGYIANSHRDYCGMGLIFDATRDCYVYGSVQDGVDVYPEKVFDSQKKFVEWLSQESDESLCGRETNDEWSLDNQRITRSRLVNLPAKSDLQPDLIGVVWAYFDQK